MSNGFLEDNQKEKAEYFIHEAIKEAKKSTCYRSKCGAIIVKDNEIIGIGFNSPPGDLESQRRCFVSKNDYDKKVTDKTCCIHAEQRAIIDALRRNPEKIKDSVLYFIRLDENGNKTFAGKLYCTICSKIALDVGIKSFVLWHEKGICVYDIEEYNDLSFKYDPD